MNDIPPDILSLSMKPDIVLMFIRYETLLSSLESSHVDISKARVQCRQTDGGQFEQGQVDDAVSTSRRQTTLHFS